VEPVDALLVFLINYPPLLQNHHLHLLLLFVLPMVAQRHICYTVGMLRARGFHYNYQV
jgi:hypothetical protein